MKVKGAMEQHTRGSNLDFRRSENVRIMAIIRINNGN